MRFYVIILLLLALVYLIAIRALLRQHIPKITSGLLILALIPLGVLELRWQNMEDTGSTVVRTVSGNPNGHLYCERFTAALVDPSADAGEVRYSKPDEAYLRYQYCQDLKSLLRGDKQQPSLAQIVALHVLTHESVHVSGNYDEADTECKAIAADPGVAEKLGISKRVALQMQARYLRDVYPRLNSAYHKTC